MGGGVWDDDDDDDDGADCCGSDDDVDAENWDWMEFGFQAVGWNGSYDAADLLLIRVVGAVVVADDDGADCDVVAVSGGKVIYVVVAAAAEIDCGYLQGLSPKCENPPHDDCVLAGNCAGPENVTKDSDDISVAFLVMRVPLCVSLLLASSLSLLMKSTANFGQDETILCCGVYASWL